MDLEREPERHIVHVSSDFPDSVEAFKTPVIRSLLDLTSASFRHEVFSLNRKSPSVSHMVGDILRNPLKPRLAVEATPFEKGTALVYHAPPRGLYHAAMLTQLGDWLAQRLSQATLPKLLIGHKLAFEGFVVARAAKQLGIPYGISIQGGSDTKVLAARPDLSQALRRIFHGASVVFPFAPWSLDAVERRLGKRDGLTVMLPCPTDLDVPRDPTPDGTGLVTTFHLKNHRRKNFKGMVEALRLLEKEGSAPELTVIGGGSDQDLAACKAVAHGQRAVKFAGALDRDGVRAAFADARGFVMPSLRESFGLVFIEALFAGLPIAYPEGTAVDGYLDGLPFALRMDARDPASIAWAMRELNTKEAMLKASLAQWLKSKDAQRFTRAEIARKFTSGLAAVA